MLDPAALICSPADIEALAEELGATHPSLEGMAKRVFHSNNPADREEVFDGEEGGMRPSDITDPWTDGCDSENTVLNHLYEKLAYQPRLDHKIINRASQTKTAFSLKDCGKSLDAGSHMYCCIRRSKPPYSSFSSYPPTLLSAQRPSTLLR